MIKTSPTHRRNWRYWLNLGLFAIGSCLVGFFFLQVIAFPVISAYGYSHPQRLNVCCTTPADLGLAYENVTITTTDGLALRGWYIPSKNRAAIILVHSLASNRMGVLTGAKMLAKPGYGLFLLDLHAHGESDGEVFKYGGPEVKDIEAAILYLQTRSDVDDSRIGIMGWSLGGQVSILAAAQLKDIKAVIADGPGATAFEDWPPPRTINERLYVPIDFMFYQIMPLYTGVVSPLSIKQAIRQISPRPIFLISSGLDTEKYRMEYFLNAAHEPKSLWVIPEASHIEGIHKQPQEYEAKVIEFFSEFLLQNNP